jgi:uncharacterized protein YjbJ (UPF0337 family)
MGLNWDIIKGQWTEMKGEARKQWGKLTDSEWEQIAGDKDKLLGRLQQHYGWSREDAEREADSFFDARRARERNS